MLNGFERGRLGTNLAYLVVVFSGKESGVSLGNVKNHPKTHHITNNIAFI